MGALGRQAGASHGQVLGKGRQAALPAWELPAAASLAALAWQHPQAKVVPQTSSPPWHPRDSPGTCPWGGLRSWGAQWAAQPLLGEEE